MSKEATRERSINEVQTENEKRHRINIDVGDAMYKRLKIQAVQEGRTVADITRSLWNEYLSK